jgi:hypothetical protein
VGENEILVVAALRESNGILRDIIEQHRRTIRMLRAINRRLRVQQATAHANDEEFKAMCSDEVYEHDGAEGGFPEALSS